MENIKQHIESLLFAADRSVSEDEILLCLQALNPEDEAPDKDLIRQTLDDLQRQYELPHFSFHLEKISGGYRFFTKPAYHQTIAQHMKLTVRKRLSRSALETLSIVAYKQPVTKTVMEKIRGVSCDYAIQKLLEKELVVILGRDQGPGKPLLYGTSEKFMDYLGLQSMDDLPKLKDFQESDSEVGEPAPTDKEA